MGSRARRKVTGHRGFDPRDSDALQQALTVVGTAVSRLTVHMCWHGGNGHDYPPRVMQSAGRLRECHSAGSDDDYTSMSFTPSDDDLADFQVVAPFCDLAYATDACGETLLEVSDEGSSGSVRDRL